MISKKLIITAIIWFHNVAKYCTTVLCSIMKQFRALERYNMKQECQPMVAEFHWTEHIIKSTSAKPAPLWVVYAVS